MSVVAVFFCFASGKDAAADLPAEVMEGARNLKRVGLHGSTGLPERQEHEKKRSGFEGRKKDHAILAWF